MSLHLAKKRVKGLRSFARSTGMKHRGFVVGVGSDRVDSRSLVAEREM